MARWIELGSAKPRAAVGPSAQLHVASQWLGRFGRAFAPAQEDDSHTSFAWRRDLQAFRTDAAPSPITGRSAPAAALGSNPAEAEESDGDGGLSPAASSPDKATLSLGLRPADLKLLAFRDDELTDEFALHGRDDGEARVWLGELLGGSGFDLAKYDAEQPYQMPAGPFEDGEIYDALSSAAALNEMARLFDNAEFVLGRLQRANAYLKPGPSAVRAWPHHFDMGLLTTIEDAPFEHARAIGAGLAIPDSLYGEYYFYTYPWPRHKRKGVKSPKSAGKLQKKGFFGAVLTMSDLLKTRDQQDMVEAFFEETTATWLNILRDEMS